MIRMIIKTTGLKAVGTLLSRPIYFEEERLSCDIIGTVDTKHLTADDYVVFLALIQKDENGNLILIDTLTNAFYFTVVEGNNNHFHFSQWDNNYSGNLCFEGIKILS